MAGSQEERAGEPSARTSRVPPSTAVLTSCGADRRPFVSYWNRERARRRADRRRRAVRHRRRLPPARALPRQDVRDPRGARRDRRHLGPVPLPGHPLGLRHVHARLLVPAVDGGEGDRRRPVDPATTSARPRASTASTGTIRFGHRVVRAEWSTRRRALDRRRPSAPTPARRSQLTCGFLFACSGYYRYDEGYTPELRRASSASRARSSTRSTGPRTSTTRASASS